MFMLTYYLGDAFVRCREHAMPLPKLAMLVLPLGMEDGRCIT